MDKNKTRKVLLELMERDGDKCHYCDIAVQPVNEFEPHSIEGKPSIQAYQTISFSPVTIRVYFGWDNILEQEGGEVTLVYGDDIRVATVDHVVPRSKGGTDKLSNLVVACHSCNCSKQARWNYEDFKAMKNKGVIEQ